jgi:hypothetical protein
VNVALSRIRTPLCPPPLTAARWTSPQLSCAAFAEAVATARSAGGGNDPQAATHSQSDKLDARNTRARMA